MLGEVTGGIGFIVAAYAVTVLVLGAMVVWVIFDRRRQDQRLQELEARGIRRRSDRRNQPGAVAPAAESPSMAREHKA